MALQRVVDFKKCQTLVSRPMRAYDGEEPQQDVGTRDILAYGELQVTADAVVRAWVHYGSVFVCYLIARNHA